MSKRKPSPKAPRELSRLEWEMLLKEVSEKARKEAFDNNLPITISRDGHVIQLYKDGKVVVLEKLRSTTRKPTSKQMRLGK